MWRLIPILQTNNNLPRFMLETQVGGHFIFCISFSIYHRFQALNSLHSSRSPSLPGKWLWFVLGWTAVLFYFFRYGGLLNARQYP